MLRSIAELVVYGTFAVLLAVASFAPADQMTSSATTSDTTPPASTVAAERGALLFAVKGVKTCQQCPYHQICPSSLTIR